MKKAHFHLPGLFEFYDFYCIFLPIYQNEPYLFYDWCDIGSIYGAPAGCIWGGGRTGSGNANPDDVISLMNEYGISPRLTFSNSLLTQEHISDKQCNNLCKLFESNSKVKSGVIIHSDLLLKHIRTNYPNMSLISSTTKVITEFDGLEAEINREEFDFVVPDFRLNKNYSDFEKLSTYQKNKIEFLCNECCWFGCKDRKQCYESVSKKNLGIISSEHICRAPNSEKGYMFSKAMKNPGFIGINDILSKYMPMGFSNFKIEGRELGSALLLEFILHYLTKPEHQLELREKMYLDNMLDLF